MSKMARGKCGRKRRYPTREAALIAVATQMRFRGEEDDWNCFRVYRCGRCGGYHLTKGGKGGEQDGIIT